jgi:hypothetical protein
MVSIFCPGCPQSWLRIWSFIFSSGLFFVFGVKAPQDVEAGDPESVDVEIQPRFRLDCLWIRLRLSAELGEELVVHVVIWL